MFLSLLVLFFCFTQLLGQDLFYGLITQDLDRITQDLRRLTDRVAQHRHYGDFNYHDYSLVTDEYFKELLQRLNSTNQQQQDTIKKLLNHVQKMTRVEERLREAERQAERNNDEKKNNNDKKNNKNNNNKNNNNKKNNNHRRNGRLVPLPF